MDWVCMETLRAIALGLVYGFPGPLDPWVLWILLTPGLCTPGISEVPGSAEIALERFQGTCGPIEFHTGWAASEFLSHASKF